MSLERILLSYVLSGAGFSTSGRPLGPSPFSTWRAVSIADSGIPVYNQSTTQRNRMNILTSKASHLECMRLPINSPLQPMYI